jgi:L-amino acid N-acyltransferase YncA
MKFKVPMSYSSAVSVIKLIIITEGLQDVIHITEEEFLRLEVRKAGVSTLLFSFQEWGEWTEFELFYENYALIHKQYRNQMIGMLLSHLMKFGGVLVA